MIISASRRTDIPAFYSEWFMNRIREGFLLVRNPFNAHQIKRVELSQRDVECIVFWTRNPKPLFRELDEIDEMGYRYYFQYTITGFPRVFETSVPHPAKAIDTFKALSERVGPARVVWRFDPIIISSVTNEGELLRLFRKIARELSGYTERVVISIADLYKTVQRNMTKVAKQSGEFELYSNDRLMAGIGDLLPDFADIALKYGLHIQSCAEEIDLRPFGIFPGKCIDDEIIHKCFGISVDARKDKGQREACGCIKSVDIGQYDTCLHGCEYCYATKNKEKAKRNYHEVHDPNSPFLLGAADGIEPSLLVPNVQENLF